MPKSPKEMFQAIAKNLPKNTGKTLDQWIDLVNKKGPKEREEQIDWLKIKHNSGHEPDNRPLVIGAEWKLDVGTKAKLFQN